MSWKKRFVHKNFSGMGFKDLTSFNVAMLDKKVGGSKLIHLVLLLNYLRHVISLIMTSLGQELGIIQVMCGKVYLVLKLW